MSTALLIVIAALLWFIWRQLETIASALTRLSIIALQRNMDTHKTP
jgi:HAMP domain-containing protein